MKNNANIINDEYVINIFKKYNINISVEKFSKRTYISKVEVPEEDLIFRNKKDISRDKRILLYNAASYANYYLMKTNRISPEIKNEYDIILTKFFYTNQCYS